MATFCATQGRTIKEAFDEFHARNPAIYALFKKFALRILLSTARKTVSSKLIINRIRWEAQVETTGLDYKINDAFTPHYARLFISDNPEHAKAFELRELRAQSKHVAVR